jgi:hypothetical protein
MLLACERSTLSNGNSASGCIIDFPRHRSLHRLCFEGGGPGAARGNVSLATLESTRLQYLGCSGEYSNEGVDAM